MNRLFIETNQTRLTALLKQAGKMFRRNVAFRASDTMVVARCALMNKGRQYPKNFAAFIVDALDNGAAPTIRESPNFIRQRIASRLDQLVAFELNPHELEARIFSQGDSLQKRLN